MNKPLDTDLFDRAVLFAVKAHAGTERRGKGIPYILHPLETAAIVATMTNNQALMAAAVLHDVVEDTDTTVEDIQRLFGDNVAQWVALESDAPVENSCDETASWMARKQAGINRLNSASDEVKMIALGDKLSNIRTMMHDFEEIGNKLWDRFHENDPKVHAWRFRALVKAFESLNYTSAYKEFKCLVERLFAQYDETAEKL